MRAFRSNSTLLALTLTACAIAPDPARSDLWKTEDQLTAEYGEPVRIYRELDDRTFTYGIGHDLVAEVEFLDGISQAIVYRHEGRLKGLSPETIDAVLDAKFPRQTRRQTDQRRWELGAPAVAIAINDSLERLSVKTCRFDEHQFIKYSKPYEAPARTGAEKRFRGVLEFKDEENESRIAIIRDGATVLEIPWAWRNFAGKAKLEPGKTYEVTLRDEERLDINTSTAFISDRVHRSHVPRTEDSESLPLVRIKDGEAIVFDEAVCELHHVRMEQRTAEIAYGLPALSGCDVNYPHHGDWIHGGCMSSESSPKTASHYVCRQCVAACVQYRREHPEEGSPRFWQRVKSALSRAVR